MKTILKTVSELVLIIPFLILILSSCNDKHTQLADCPCPDKEEPVCGFHGPGQKNAQTEKRTYRNSCLAQCKGASSFTPGPCPL